jgi:glycosyltransferase involved in cell wall biosynthesis
LRLLFVGGLSQRKGIADVFAVAEALKPHVELTVVGSKSMEGCAVLNEALSRHRWLPSLPHVKILELMREHDVLLFPSLFEGFGLVITEAMSQGTPVITTERTAGPDVIQSGENGWLVPAGSTEALKASVEEILRGPDCLSAASEAARETARLRPWKIYGDKLAEALCSFEAGRRKNK